MKCLKCKEDKPLVDRSDYCADCYKVLQKRVHDAADRTRKPDWMDQEDWIMSRIEMTKENIVSGGQMVESQEISLQIHKVKCNATFCGKTFYEFGDLEALQYCPHCAAKIDPENSGEVRQIKLGIETRTGRVRSGATTISFGGDKV